MGSISKALGAGLGGAALGTGSIPFLPDGTPWYGYLLIYAVSVIVPAITTYLAPANKS